jgi:hypothetical protein
VRRTGPVVVLVDAVGVVNSSDVVLVKAKSLVLDEVELSCDHERADDEEDGHVFCRK